MVWAKFDDQYPHHPKLIKAGRLDAIGLDVAAICYASRHLTDGFVADHALSSLYPPARNPKKMADLLVAVGRWTRDDALDGYWIHDFLKYNRSRVEVEEERTRSRERMANKRRNNGRSSSEHPPNFAGCSDAPTTTRPVPDLLSEISSSPPPSSSSEPSGGGEEAQTRDLLLSAGFPPDVVDEAIARSRLRSVSGGVTSFAAYAEKRARSIVEERQQAAEKNRASGRRRAYMEALTQGEFDRDCEHGTELHLCREAFCAAATAGIVDRYETHSEVSE